MQAIVLEGGFGIDKLRRVERARPTPRAGQAVLRMRAAALNYRDLEVIRGSYFVPCRPPLVPLSDGVGEVVAVGEGVERVSVGERVAATFWGGWLAGDAEAADPSTTLGGPLDGVLAEYVCIDAQRLVRVPAHLSDEEAATLPCAGVTAWHALVSAGRVTPGETVLIQGTGGVAMFALQFAVLSGAQGILLSSSEEKLARARSCGAAHTLRRTANWPREVRELTAGRGVDHVIELGGPSSFAQSLEALRPGGQVHVIGYLGGQQGLVNPLALLTARAVVRAVTVGSRSSFEAMNRALAQHRFKPVLDTVLPWTALAEGLARLEAGRHVGKIALTFGAQ